MDEPQTDRCYDACNAQRPARSLRRNRLLLLAGVVSGGTVAVLVGCADVAGYHGGTLTEKDASASESAALSDNSTYDSGPTAPLSRESGSTDSTSTRQSESGSSEGGDSGSTSDSDSCLAMSC